MRLHVSSLGRAAAWAWTLLAGGRGLWLLTTRGPWPPTNGWFALLSGVAACPLVAWSLKKYAGISVSGWLQFSVALLIWVAGLAAALTIWPTGVAMHHHMLREEGPKQIVIAITSDAADFNACTAAGSPKDVQLVSSIPMAAK